VQSAIAEYFRALSARDKTAWFSVIDATAVIHEPVGTSPAEGREGLEQVWQMFTGPFTTLALHPDEIYYAGSGAAVRWSASASSGDQRTVDFRGISVFEIDVDGKIQTVMSYWDPAEVLIRLAGGDDDEPV
jgi:ketosteroid isomerase-like protein